MAFALFALVYIFLEYLVIQLNSEKASVRRGSSIALTAVITGMFLVYLLYRQVYL